MGGTDLDTNLVYLTAKEHFVAHLLLHKLHPENDKLLFAFWAMCNQNRMGNRYVPSSRTYERAKEEYIRRTQKRVVFDCTYCGKENIRIVSHIRPMANYCNRECYLLAARSKKALGAGRIHINKNGTQKLITPSELAEYPDWNIGRLCITKEVIQIDPVSFEEIHTYSKMQDVLNRGFNPAGVSRCAHGYTKSHKGFIWRFKEEN